MTPEFDGHSNALQRIAVEARDRTGSLDLRQLGLTELPQTLLQLVHRRSLYLGRRFVYSVEEKRWVLGSMTNRPLNSLEGQLDQLKVIPV